MARYGEEAISTTRLIIPLQLINSIFLPYHTKIEFNNTYSNTIIILKLAMATDINESSMWNLYNLSNLFDLFDLSDLSDLSTIRFLVLGCCLCLCSMTAIILLELNIYECDFESVAVCYTIGTFIVFFALSIIIAYIMLGISVIALSVFIIRYLYATIKKITLYLYNYHTQYESIHCKNQ